MEERLLAVARSHRLLPALSVLSGRSAAHRRSCSALLLPWRARASPSPRGGEAAAPASVRPSFPRLRAAHGSSGSSVHHVFSVMRDRRWPSTSRGGHGRCSAASNFSPVSTLGDRLVGVGSKVTSYNPRESGTILLMNDHTRPPLAPGRRRHRWETRSSATRCWCGI